MISARDPDKKRFHSFLSGFCFSLRSNKNIAPARTAKKQRVGAVFLNAVRPAGLDPESRLFYFASLIKQTRVLGRPLFIFPPCEVGKIYSAASSPDASKIVCLLWAYFTS